MQFCTLLEPKTIIQSFPGTIGAINSGYNDRQNKAELAVNIVCIILINSIENISSVESRNAIGKAIIDSYEDPDMVTKFVADAAIRIKDNIKNNGMAVDINDIQWRIQHALICVTTLYENGIISDNTKSWFFDEIGGALDGQSSEQRASDRIRDTLSKTLHPQFIETDDNSQYLPVENALDMTTLSGIEYPVKVVNTPTGIVLIKESDGQQVTNRRSLTQEDLQKIPSNAYDCIFVNLPAPNNEIYSCVVAQPDTQVFGSMRAFWWSLAKTCVETTNDIVNNTAMTEKNFQNVYNSARGMWNSAIENAGCIDNMRDRLIPLRNLDLDVISQMKDEAAGDKSILLGLEVAQAMILATQSGDRLLEAFAFKCFKKFLWQPGEEPSELYENLNIEPSELLA
jgi:hypothetical protein